MAKGTIRVLKIRIICTQNPYVPEYLLYLYTNELMFPYFSVYRLTCRKDYESLVNYKISEMLKKLT